jgi:glyoxylase-like metal-dependent hydrolase (beta-lactamase superfamily II)
MLRTPILAAALAAAASLALAQPAPGPPKLLKVTPLRPGVALLVGPGGNITMGYGPGKVVLVDTEIAAAADAAIATAASLDPRPVAVAIDTHWHFDHAGGDAALRKAGAEVIAHANVAARLKQGGTVTLGKRVTNFPPAPAEALPSRTYDKELTLEAGGDRLRLVHPEHAHTDGDTIVKWTKANVLDMGDIYVRYGLPFVDTASGGSLRGMVRGVEAGLALCDKDTIVIPGHGDPASRADLAAYRDRLAKIADGVDKAIREGKTLEQTQALRLADDFPLTPQSPISPDQFVAMAYASAQPAGR